MLGRRKRERKRNKLAIKVLDILKEEMILKSTQKILQTISLII